MSGLAVLDAGIEAQVAAIRTALNLGDDPGMVAAGVAFALKAAAMQDGRENPLHGLASFAASTLVWAAEQRKPETGSPASTLGHENVSAHTIPPTSHQ